MSLSKYKRIFGGQTIRVDTFDLFTYDHNDHNGGTIIVANSQGIGALYVDFTAMASNNGASLRIVTTTNLVIDDTSSTMYPTSVEGIGVFDFETIDGVIYCNATISADVRTAKAQIGDYDQEKRRLTIAQMLDQIYLQLPAPGTVVGAKASSYDIEIDEGITLDITAKTKGVVGDDITVSLVDPKEIAASEVVSVDGSDITVILASDGDAITSTLASVKAAIEADVDANALISVAITGLNTTLAIEVSEQLEGGIDGTEALAGKILFDDDYVWFAKADCYTYDTSGWLQLSLT